jgi:two-component system sensor kinase
MAGTAPSRTSDNSSKSELFRLLVDGIKDYAIIVLSPDGNVLTWNLGAAALMGYKEQEILGTHFSKFYLSEAVQSGEPVKELVIAEKEGRFANECWHSRKDGSTFWASVVITPLRGSTGELCGFAKVTQDLTERREAAESINNLNLALQKLSARVLHAQDEERRRIARELHDDLGQQLSTLKMILDRTQNADASELTAFAVKYVRNLAYLLHPPLLDETGLRGALNWFIPGLTERGTIEIELKMRPDDFPRLGLELETAIFRIVQESLNNVFRHANADRASVELEKQQDLVVVRIRDYGKGLPPDIIARGNYNGGVGIAGMRERIRHLGGKLSLSRCEPGTLVEATIPIKC